MTEKRKLELALKVLKYFLKKEGIHFTAELRREIGNMAKAIGIRSEEAMEFMRIILHEMVDEYLVKGTPEES